MRLNELIGKLQEIQERHQDLTVECSVDISVDGQEETYADRVFGKEPYMVRVIYDFSGEKIKEAVQILFEKGEVSKELEEENEV